ncbi:gas vesicle protein [Anaerosolibacter carboniphilus]|uniref:Gas vesicle protein n=1 Tax=Anaerosolibacter carboniphilus TaxID=1417629 RepID=A0A841L8V6_9FIRM|nr:YtxH domain-containing protein [Anaerosolibacter carboniphilus]MBB6218695.1 gas vesicle protein [Anaerosolibacter carboniphilus]
MRLVRNLQRKRKLEQQKKLAKGVALGTLVGGILGSTAGILLAPDSGKNTRKKIQDGATELKTNVEKNVEEVKSNLGNTLKSRKENIRDVVGKIRNLRKNPGEDVAACADVIEEEIAIVSEEKSE